MELHPSHREIIIKDHMDSGSSRPSATIRVDHATPELDGRMIFMNYATGITECWEVRGENVLHRGTHRPKLDIPIAEWKAEYTDTLENLLGEHTNPYLD